MKEETESRVAVISEMLFVFLPILVISILNINKGLPTNIFFTSEWSFAAIVLFGQALVKFSAGISKNGKRYRWQIISLITSLVVVLGLIPSVVFLILVIQDAGQSFWLHIFQLILFTLSAFVFLFLGTTGQVLMDCKQ